MSSWWPAVQQFPESCPSRPLSGLRPPLSPPFFASFLRNPGGFGQAHRGWQGREEDCPPHAGVPGACDRWPGDSSKAASVTRGIFRSGWTSMERAGRTAATRIPKASGEAPETFSWSPFRGHRCWVPDFFPVASKAASATLLLLLPLTLSPNVYLLSNRSLHVSAACRHTSQPVLTVTLTSQMLAPRTSEARKLLRATQGVRADLPLLSDTWPRNSFASVQGAQPS